MEQAEIEAAERHRRNWTKEKEERMDRTLDRVYRKLGIRWPEY